MALTEVGRRGVSQVRDKCKFLVNSVMKFGFHNMLRNIRVTTQLVTSDVLHRSIVLVINYFLLA